MGLSNLVINEKDAFAGVVLHWPPSFHWREQQFFDFCQANKELRIERNAQGDCEIMAPTRGETGRRNLALAAQLYLWAEHDGSGIAFGSSTGYTLPNGAVRSPDVSWVRKAKYDKLRIEQKRGFLPFCPDVVIELRSPSDGLNSLMGKMLEYRDNGAELGWLIDPEQKRVYEYQMDDAIKIVENPGSLSADSLLKGFVLELGKILA